MGWDTDLTIGQTGTLTIGRTFHQPFWDEEGDEQIVEDSARKLADPKNERGLYSANIGLSSEFDISNRRMRESSLNQGWGRWISGGMDAAVAWWLAPEVLGAKVVGKGLQKASTVFLTAQADRALARTQFSMGKQFAEGVGGKRTAIYDLAEVLSKMPKQHLVNHEIAKLSTDPAFVADVFANTKTADDAFDALLALGGDQQAIQSIADKVAAKTVTFNGKETSVLDALTMAAKRKKEILDDMDEVLKQKSIVSGGKTNSAVDPVLGLPVDKNKGLTPIFDRWEAQMNSQLNELQKIVDESAEILEPFQPIMRAVDLKTGLTRGEVRINKLNVGRKGSFGVNRVYSQAAKAEKRYKKITGENLWTSTQYKAGGKWGRTIRVFHAAADYAGTTKIRGIARVSDAKDSLIEMESALTTNPLLRRLTRANTNESTDEVLDAINGEWMPSARRTIEEKKFSMTDEAWDEFVASGEFDAWVKQKRLKTANQFRENYYNRVLSSMDELERFRAFDDYEQEMFMEQALYYGLNQQEAMQILEQYKRMKNQISTQIKERGWYWDKSSNEIHSLPQLQSELAEGKPLLDFSFMDRVYRINAGGISGASQSARMSLSAVMSTIDAVWRPLVLMRLGYTVRNVAESNIREMAYASQIPSGRNFSATRKAEDMKWVNWAANAGDRIGQIRNFAVHGPLRYGTKGTFKALRNTLDEESRVLARRTSLYEDIRKEVADARAEQQRFIDREKRRASVKIARSVAKSKVPGESVVWQRIEEGIARRRDFFETVDEILIDPEYLDSLRSSGWVTGRFGPDADNDLLAVTGNRLDPLGGEGDNWRRWLTEEENNNLMGNGAAPIYRSQMLAMQRWLDATGGEQGFPVRMIDPKAGHVEVIHNPLEWYDGELAKGLDTYDLLDSLRIVPSQNIDQIKGGRVQVGGGVLDLRPGGFGDNWNRVEIDPSVWWADTWTRLYKYSDVGATAPSRLYPKVSRITDPMGGTGKYEDAVGYVDSDKLAYAYLEPEERLADAPFTYSQTAAAEWDSPIIIEAYGDPSRPTTYLADGFKRLRAMQDEAVQVPVVVRWMDYADEPLDRVAVPLKIDSKGKLAYLSDDGIRAANEMRDAGARHINPEMYSKFRGPSQVQGIKQELEAFDYMDNSPAWESLRDFFDSSFQNADLAVLVDVARTVRAAELNPIVRKQVELRLGDVDDPGLTKWLMEKGHIMDDTEFRQLVADTVPLDQADAIDQVSKGFRSMSSYKGNTYRDVNNSLWKDIPIDPNSTEERVLRGMDWATQRTNVVTGTEPMRLWRDATRPLEDGHVPAFLSTSMNPAIEGIWSQGSRAALDVQPGVPYASYERLMNDNWEQEIVLPRGIKVEYTGTTAHHESVGHVPLYKVTWDPDDVENIAIGHGWVPQTPRSDSYSLGWIKAQEKVGGQLGGYTYGQKSGVWQATNGQTFYVKDYDNTIQGFLEYFFDSHYSIANKRRTSTMMRFDDGSFAYASVMEPDDGLTTVGEAISRGLTEEEARALKAFMMKGMAEDVLVENFDALGPGLENMYLFENYLGTVYVAKLDNGASGPFRAHGEVAPHKTPDLDYASILDRAETNGYRRLITELENYFAKPMSDDFLREELRREITRNIKGDLEAYGPLGDRFYRFFDEWTTTTPGAHLDSDLRRQAADLAEWLNDRQRNILLQVNRDEPGYGAVLAQELYDRTKELTGKSSIQSTDYVGRPPHFIPDESRPAASIVHGIDKPDVISESGIVQQLAEEYALEQGYGKIITPNPSKGRGYQVRVNPDRIYNGGDNIDATYPGWLSESIAENGETVLDMTRATPQELFASTGMDIVTGSKVLGGTDTLPREVRSKLAMRMGNEGYTHIALPNGRKLSQSELIGSGDAGAAYGAALAGDELDEVVQVALAKSERYSDITTRLEDAESRLRASGSRLEERKAAVAKAQERLSKRMTKRKRAGDAVFSGGQLNEKVKYTVRTPEGWEQKEEVIPSAFGEQASLWQQLTSSNDRVAADIMGLGELTYRGMRTTKQKAVLKPYTDQYWRGLAEYGEKNFSNDVIGEALLKGKSDDEIIDLMFNTTRGQSAIRKMDDFKEFRGLVSKDVLGEGMRDDMVGLIQERRNILDTYFPDPEIRDMMINPKKTLTPDALRLRLGPRTDLKDFEGNLTIQERAMGRRAISSIMHVLGTMPEDKLARHPFFRNRYRESMMNQIQNYADQGIEEFGKDALEQMSRIARKESLQILNNTLYTIQRVSTFADSMRLFLPFFPAWSSSVRFWLYQVPKSRPENLVRYAMVDSAPDRAGWTVDEDNNRVSGPNTAAFAFVRKIGSTEATSIAFQIAEEDLGWFERVIGPQSNIKIPKGSLDMMLQGEFPLIPTSSPLVSVPMAWIGAMRPDITSYISDTGDFTFQLGDDEETIVTSGTLGDVALSRVMPFGRPESDKDLVDSIIDGYSPAWLNKLVIGARGESSAQLASLAAEIHRSRMTDWDLSDKTGEAPRYADSVVEAQQFQVFRSLINASAPFSPQFQSKYQFYIDSWRDIQDQGYSEGWSLDEMEAVFIQRYGKEFFRYTRSKSGNQSGMSSDLGEYKAVVEYEGTAGQMASLGNDAKFINMLTKPFNTGEGFNEFVYAWQMDRVIPGSGGRTFRGGTQQKQLEYDSQIELGWKEYNAQVTKLEALAESKGSSPDAVAAAKRKLVGHMAQQKEYQGWYSQFQEINGGRWVDSVNAMYLMMNDEKLMAEYGPPEDTPYEEMNGPQQYFWAVGQFIEMRNWAVAKLEQAEANGGSANIDAKSNAALAKVVNQRIMDLGDINENFRYMHRRYFGGDKYKRTEDIAEVSNG